MNTNELRNKLCKILLISEGEAKELANECISIIDEPKPNLEKIRKNTEEFVKEYKLFFEGIHNYINERTGFQSMVLISSENGQHIITGEMESEYLIQHIFCILANIPGAKEMFAREFKEDFKI